VTAEAKNLDDKNMRYGLSVPCYTEYSSTSSTGVLRMSVQFLSAPFYHLSSN
jgi:hypothetical protein